MTFLLEYSIAHPKRPDRRFAYSPQTDRDRARGWMHMQWEHPGEIKTVFPSCAGAPAIYRRFEMRDAAGEAVFAIYVQHADSGCLADEDVPRGVKRIKLPGVLYAPGEAEDYTSRTNDRTIRTELDRMLRRHERDRLRTAGLMFP